MEFCEGNTLKAFLEKRKEISRQDNYEIFYQILRGLKHIHANNVIHRDLKPENIFLIYKKEKLIVKIGDFGLAREEVQQNEAFSPSIRRFSSKSTDLGTALYAAPEQLNANGRYNEKVDIYSLGLILLEMCSLAHT